MAATTIIAITVGGAVVLLAAVVYYLVARYYEARYDRTYMAQDERGFKRALEGKALIWDFDPMRFSAFAPEAVRRGDEVLIHAAVFNARDERAVNRAMHRIDVGAQTKTTVALTSKLRRGEFEIRLDADYLSTPEPVAWLTWNGKPAIVTFRARVAKGAPSQIVVRLRLFQGSVPKALALFALEVGEQTSRTRQEAAFGEYENVFLSYASSDRVEVLKHYQLLKRLGLNVFQDVLELDPGERWEKALYKHIDEADLVLLYWSTAAAKSEWVEREAVYALQCSERAGGRPDLVPVLLEGPPPPAPPQSLSAIHFNDPVRFIILAQQVADEVRRT